MTFLRPILSASLPKGIPNRMRVITVAVAMMPSRY